ncbi:MULTISPECIES: DUF3352 domain-containing protein [Arthrospira]|jgi:hypothetical protein|uniref:DUF3352 domain-containing protein n=1 Tax=Limnospira platensis NIES-46 TaxID=1236695 RepID=A0A5M3SZY6_LIMPL|nr:MULTISPECIES: DUF3352 domain-containing protein [Arthrospira]AMW27908.1 hypothetical protein AP285_07850 [Arthrospira platensis YZ]KDR54414.1 hypothetical protein APPUASWS_028220 [Arthrospira platensis str. Paraca]MBD2670649.1 DUF3352 domain-containing protein [Arthrospira platensis FACHB-439]MBD2711380.1 DUF3352 domain-containing protein [Arthrospira platensis FACHB-835]MDT9183824.1 DUF3352 domain-containing protein [Limnospira sp. PMC 289.06]MDT9311708.1 DUF3352 domain-containing protein
MKLKSFFILLGIATATLLLVGVSFFLTLLGETPLSLLKANAKTIPTATVFVPKNAPFTASLLVNPDRLEAFRQVLAEPKQRQRSHQEFNRFKKILLGNTGLNYKRDIKPWLGGEITLSLIAADIDRDSSNDKQPGYLLALTSQNPQQSQEFLELFWQRQAVSGVMVTSETYRGVSITYRQRESVELAPTLATAVLSDRFILFANYPKVLREAINNFQVSTLNLANSQTYQKAIAALDSSQIGLVFLNLGNWELTPDEINALPIQPSLALGLTLNPQGLLADTAIIATTSEEFEPPLLSEPPKALNYISANSPLVVTGRDLNDLWAQTSGTIGSNETLGGVLTRARVSIQESWGVDLPEDIFNWVTEEYALALVPHPIGDRNDWVFVAKRTPLAATAIEALDAIATERGYSVGSFVLGDYTLWAWTQLKTVPIKSKNKTSPKKQVIEAEAMGVHATVGDYEIFTTSVEAMDAAIHRVETGNILTNPEFSNSIKLLSGKNDGYFYIDWDVSRPILRQQMPLLRLVELSAQPFFNHLRSLTISARGRENGVQKATVFAHLQ